MKLLWDGDILVYRTAWASQDESEGIAISRLEKTLAEGLDKFNTELYQVILSPTDKSNFRYQVDPLYKSHRIQPKPIHYEAMREHLLEVHNASVAHGEEADDLLGILQMEHHQLTGSSEGNHMKLESIIVSIDKDLNQIPGNHYNYVKGDIYYVSPVEGTRWFYKQMLQGDATDGIKGVKGIGPVSANKWLDGVTDERELYNIVSELYQSEFKELTERQIRTNGQLLWIRRERGQIWQPPT